MGKSRRQKSASRPPTRAVPQRRTLVAPLLIAVIALAVYANSLAGPFVFDDLVAISANSTIRQLWPVGPVLRTPPRTPLAGRPAANLSFAINYALGGLDVRGYHLGNIAVHILAALALFGVLRRILSREPDRTADRWALLCTMAWVLHPLNTEAVDYLTQRTESMAGLLYLLTLYASIRAWKDAHPRRWQAVAVAAAFCGVATKESVVIAPLMVVLCDRVFLFASFSEAFRRRGRFYASLATSWLVFAVLMGQTPFFGGGGFETSVSRWTYLLNQAPMIVRYLRLSLWPSGLIFDYGTPLALTLSAVWPSVLFVVALLALAVLALVRMPAVGFWMLWFFVTLAPASSVIPIPTEVGAERRMYLPLIAVIVLVVLGARRLLEACPIAWRPLAWRVASAVALFTLVAFGVQTVRRNAEYGTSLSIWQTVLDRRPVPRAHLNLAVQLRDAGRVDEAIAHFRVAAPTIPDAQHALGSALLEQGDVRGAIAWLEPFVRDHPQDREIVSAREELGTAYVRAGAITQATAEFRTVTSLAPSSARGHLNLAAALAATNDIDGAVMEYEQYLRLQPDDVGTGLELVGLLLKRDRVAEAEARSRAIVSRSPNDSRAHNMLGVALASAGRYEDATKQFVDAVRLDPRSTEARNNLNRVMSLQGRTTR